MAYLTGISPTLRELVTPTVDVFADGVGFNDGSSTYIDLSADPGNENNVHITFDGVTQHHDTYTVSGVRVTFDAAIPTGTAKIEARYAQEHPNYMVTQDNSITNAKMADDAIGVAELSASGTASSSTYLRGDNAWGAMGGAGSILEVVPLVCDGSAVTVPSGTYTSTDVTAAQTSTQTYADITGSSINYTPPSGTSSVIYEFQFMTGYGGDATGCLHIKLFLDGTEVSDARGGYSCYSMILNRPYFKWVFRVGDGNDTGAGKVATWSSGKIIKLQARDYSSSSTVKIHETDYWDGTGGQHVGKPVLTVTAID
jgi:hypothetical protein